MLKNKYYIIRGGQEQYDFVNYLNGFSITTVVIMHLLQHCMVFPSTIGNMLSFGGTGAHVFFFCSGFGLNISLRKKYIDYLTFLKQRFLKIYLPYVTVVLLLFCLPFTFSGNMSDRVIALLSHIFLFKMFVPSLEVSFAYPLWYMSTLFQFYLTFHVLYLIKEKLKAKSFIVICFFSSMIWSLLTVFLGINEERIWGSFFIQYLWEFSIGMCLSDYLYKGNTIKISNICIILAGLTGTFIGGLLGLKGGAYKSFNDIFVVTGYISIAIIISQVIPFYKNICLKINKFSYEWYLLHASVFEAVFLMGFDNRYIKYAQAVIAFILSILCAILFNKFFRFSAKQNKLL